MFTDTAWYFLCFNADTSNHIPLRYQLNTDTTFTGFTPESYYFSKSVLTFQEEYYRGAFLPASEKYYVSDYAGSEGWISYLIGLNQSREFQIKTTDASNAVNGTLEMKIIGSSDFFLENPNAPNHHIQVFIGNTTNPTYLISDTTYRGYGERYILKSIPASLLGSTMYVKVQVVNDLSVSSDLNGISYIRIDYASGQNNTESLKAFTLSQSGSSRKMIQMNGFSGSKVFDFFSLIE